MYCRIVVQPPVEPLSLAEVKIDRAIDHDLHDDLLTALIQAAREYVEGWCQRSLVTQTREAGFDSFESSLFLPYGPVQEIVSVEYVASDGTPTPVSEYQSNIYGDVASIAPPYNDAWPTSVGASVNAVTVRYVAGYAPLEGSPTDYVANVPQALKTAMRLLVGNWYENREASVTGTINAELAFGVNPLMMPYRMRKGMA